VIEICEHVSVLRSKATQALPVGARRALYVGIFTHLATRVSSVLIGPAAVPACSMAFVAKMGVDLETLKEAADACTSSIRGADDDGTSAQEGDSLIEPFAEVQQLVRLLLGPHSHDYLDPSVRPRLYPGLRPALLISALPRQVLCSSPMMTNFLPPPPVGITESPNP